MPENPLKKLRLISYKAHKEESLGRQIPEGSREWFLAEKCARHVAITLNPDAVIPSEVAEGDARTRKQCISFHDDRFATRVEEGESAYAYLLMTTLGLLNKHMGDAHAKGKVVDNYAKFKAKGWLPDGMATLMDYLFTDCKNIHEVALSKLVTISEEPAVAARKLLAMKKGEDSEILIIGDKDGVSAKTFKNTFKVLGRHCAKVYITQPDAASLPVAYDNILYEQQRNDFPIAVEAVPPENLTPEFLKKIRHIFVCCPMGANPEFEQTLIHNWKEHCVGQTSLTHLCAPPEDLCQTSGMWTQLKGMPEFIDHEVMDARDKQVWTANRSVLNEAINACRNCAHTRAQGDGSKRPLKSLLTKEPEYYARLTSSSLFPIL